MDEGTTHAGDWVRFSTYQPATASSSATVEGLNVGGRAAAAVVSGTLVIVLVDINSSYFDFYLFDFREAGLTNLGEGYYWRYLKTSQVAGVGDPARALKFEPAPFGTGLKFPSNEEATTELGNEIRNVLGSIQRVTVETAR